MIIPKWLFREPIENKIQKNYNPNRLRQIARDIIKKDDKQLNKQLAGKMINPYYFTDRAVQVGFTITLESRHINHAISEITVKPKYPEFGIEVRYVNKNFKELSVIYASLINQKKLKCQTVFSARFGKRDEESQVLDETELFINVNINHNVTESDLDKNDIKPPLEHQIQQQEVKDSG